MPGTKYALACAALALGVTVGTSGPAAAQQNWTPGKRFTESATRVMGGIDRTTKGTNYGYCGGICILAAFLTNGADATFVRHFAQGDEYAIIGGGDDGVVDLDLTVTNAAGRTIASDTDLDAKPVVTFTAPSAGMYTIKVTMAKAAKNGGFATVGILMKGGYRVPVDNLAAALTSLIVQCEDVNDKTAKQVYFSSGNNQWAVFGSMVAQGGDQVVEKLTPGPGTRVFLSGGDKTTQDIDLFLTDANGKGLKDDTDPDAIPRVVYQTRANALYGFRVKNVQSRGASLILTAVLTVEN